MNEFIFQKFKFLTHPIAIIMSYNVYFDTTWGISHLRQMAATFMNLYTMNNLKHITYKGDGYLRNRATQQWGGGGEVQSTVHQYP